MSDRVKNEQHSQRIVPVVGQSGQSIHAELNGTDVRIDPPHSFPHSPEIHGVEWQKLEHFVPPASQPSARSGQSVAQSLTPDEALIKAIRLQAQYRTQVDGLDQRERALQFQWSAFEDERQQFDQRIGDEQARLDARNEHLIRKEASLTERMIAFESQRQQFEAELQSIDRIRGDLVDLRTELERQRMEVDQRKNSLREELLTEHQSEREVLNQMKQSLQRDIDQAASLKDSVSGRMATLSAQNEQLLKEERIKLWQSMTGDWEQRKAEFDREKAEWIQAREREQQLFDQERENWTRLRSQEKIDIERERAIFEAAIASANAEFLRNREALQIELDQLRSTHQADLARQQQDWIQIRQREQAELAKRAEAVRAEVRDECEAVTTQLKLHREQHLTQIELERSQWQEVQQREELALQQARDAFEQQVLATNTKLNLDLDATRDQFTTNLTTERAQWEALCQAHQQQMDSEQDELLQLRKAQEQEILVAREELKSAWQQFENSIAIQTSDWEKVRQNEIAEIESMRNEAAAAREALLLETKTVIDDELTRLREELTSRLDAERADWMAIKASQEQELELGRENLERLHEQFEATFARQKAEWDKIRQYEIAEIETQRIAVISAQDQMLDESRKALEIELNDLRNQHLRQLAAERNEWEQIRSRDNEQLSAASREMDESRQALEIELSDLRNQQLRQLAAERSEWEQIRARENEILSAGARELDAVRNQFEETITGQQVEWEKIRKHEIADIENQRAEILAARQAMISDAQAALEVEFVALREALELEFIAQREQHAQKLSLERTEWESIRAEESAELERHRNDFHREKSLVESRIRFQQDHLEKTRDELERTQNEFRRERQLELHKIEEKAIRTDNRARQVDLYRAAIDEREKSLDRELDVFNRTRKAITSTAEYDRLNFLAEKHAWEQERQLQQTELNRRHEALTIRNDGMDARQERLDRLRAELEETHRSTLEMRLAIEESWAQFTHAAGQDDARQRVEQIRQALVSYYQQMHQSLADQRREFAESQSKFERQRLAFTEERQQMTLAMTRRDEELQQEEERLRLLATEATANHAKWLNARDQWLVEKSEAERLIRRLLTALGDRAREPDGDREAIFKLEEMNRGQSLNRATGA